MRGARCGVRGGVSEVRVDAVHEANHNATRERHQKAVTYCVADDGRVSSTGKCCCPHTCQNCQLLPLNRRSIFFRHFESTFDHLHLPSLCFDPVLVLVLLHGLLHRHVFLFLGFQGEEFLSFAFADLVGDGLSVLEAFVYLEVGWGGMG